jgi:Zn-dependent metalloprotease
MHHEPDLKTYWLSKNDTNSKFYVLYTALDNVYELFKNAFNYKLIDAKGSHVTVTMHFDQNYANAYWGTDQHLVFGDGDQTFLADFPEALDVIPHDLTHGIIE